MIPHFLKPFEAELEKFKIESIKVNAKPLSTENTNDPLSLTQSKFSGLPFLPLGNEYPKDNDGKYMPLIAQINFSEIPTLPQFPDSGILQLFFSQDNWYDDEYIIVYHDHQTINQTATTDFSYLKENMYEESPVFAIHQLSFKKQIENGNAEDFRCNFEFNGLDYYDFQTSLTEEQQTQMDLYFQGGGHKIGGYSYFTQGDFRDGNEDDHNQIQLLQIDIDDHICFGDSGIGHIFIDKEDLLHQRFDKAYFYWDCL